MLQEEYKNVRQFYYFNKSTAKVWKIWKNEKLKIISFKNIYRDFYIDRK